MGLTIEQLEAKVVALEARLANGAEADQAISTVEQKPGTLHPNTVRKMKEHAPPLTATERTLWLARFKPGRRFKVSMMASKGFPGDRRARQKALRIGFWLKHEGHIFYDESKRQYVRPVGTT